MTFSIVARCPRTGHFGVGALTAMAGVGKLVAHIHPAGGAAATQATINPFLAYDGLPQLVEGRSPQEVVEEMLANDPGREVRQVGMVDREGRSYAYTGAKTLDWSGHHIGPGFAAQGNRLVGPEILDKIVEVFLRHEDLDLAERFLLAIEAGEATGGDKEGAQSATVSIGYDQPYPLWDLRADHAEDPAAELRRLYGIFREQMVPTIDQLPTRDDPMGDAARKALS